MSDPYKPIVAQADRVHAGLVVHLVAAGAGLPAESVWSPGRRTDERRARWSAIYLCYVALGWSLERTSHAFAVNRASAAKACRWAEDERDRPDFDAALEKVESLLRDSLQGFPSDWLQGSRA